MRGAVAGIAVFEGWANDLDAAAALAARGAFQFRPNHDFVIDFSIFGWNQRQQGIKFRGKDNVFSLSREWY